MIEPRKYENIHISSFDKEGLPVYVFKEEAHNYWDACSCLDYVYSEDEDDRPSRRKNKKKTIKQRYDEGDPTVGPLGEPFDRFDYLINYSTPKSQLEFTLTPLTPCKSLKPRIDFGLASSLILAITMFKYTNYDTSFPPLEERTVNQTRFMYQVNCRRMYKDNLLRRSNIKLAF